MWNRRKFGGAVRGMAGAQEVLGGVESQAMGTQSQGWEGWQRGASVPASTYSGGSNAAVLDTLSSTVFTLLEEVESLETQARDLTDKLRSKPSVLPTLREELLQRHHTLTMCLTNTLSEHLTHPTDTPSPTIDTPPSPSPGSFQEMFQEALNLQFDSQTTDGDGDCDKVDLFADGW